jgi:hypothetical protein
MPIRVLSRSSNEQARKRGDSSTLERVVLNALPNLDRFAAIICHPLPSRFTCLLFVGLSFSKATGAPEKLIPRRPALGLSVAQPNPSVANSLQSDYSA